MLPRPPSSPLFPYTTLFRSRVAPADSLSLRTPEVLYRDYLAARYGTLAAMERAYAERRPEVQVFGSSLCISARSEEHTSELQSRRDLVCRLLLEKKKKNKKR